MDSEVEKFSVDELCDYMYDKVPEPVIWILREQSITGAVLTKLTEEDLKELFPTLGHRLSVAVMLRSLKQTVSQQPPIHKVSLGKG